MIWFPGTRFHEWKRGERGEPDESLARPQKDPKMNGPRKLNSPYFCADFEEAPLRTTSNDGPKGENSRHS
jgi:hypothetical protein